MPTILSDEAPRTFAAPIPSGRRRVGEGDHERIRRILLDAVTDCRHDLEVDTQQVVAAHAGLARYAGRDDHHVRALDRAYLRPDVLGVDLQTGGLDIRHQGRRASGTASLTQYANGSFNWLARRVARMRSAGTRRSDISALWSSRCRRV